jgi:aminopeptidase N
VLKAVGQYDADARTYTLTLSQSCAPTVGQAEKLPFVIPVQMGLLTASGQPIALQLQGEETAQTVTSRMLVLTEAEQSFVFSNVSEAPVPSLLRTFSAPVVLEHEFSDADLLTLLAHDSDPFNQWEASQRLGLRYALKAIAASGEASAEILPADFIEAMRRVLRDDKLDAAFKDLVLTLPSESYIAEQLAEVDPQRVHAVREAMILQLATALQPEWESLGGQPRHRRLSPRPCQRRPPRAGRPRPVHAVPACRSNWRHGLARQGLPALQGRRQYDGPHGRPLRPGLQRQPTGRAGAAALSRAVQARCAGAGQMVCPAGAASDRGGDVLPAVKALMKHADFQIKNPNRARSLIFSYCNNAGAFHRADAAGYVFWADRVIEIDGINPQVASRLARVMDRWKKLAEPYRSAAREAIARVAAKPDLSNDVREVITRALAD